MAATLATIGFCRVLDGLQVVRDRDDRKQNQQHHRQGKQLHAPIAAGARGVLQPNTEHAGSQQDPGEIEDQLHSQS